ncbi:unnamed protein product [Rangifer tarandus platyrhynchus]|uniref:Uncharacterized protein n=2 Tax=Rangifer tarandus platyrhynchus TaxID=3082113 RepID=A0ABN8YZA2_RANTA|nr:unnamed protein product [Rangifer tarandus platyrhynchus]CAI9705533.1 unnamed protein product [Rangifer tarandus platyrhynchus]
MAVKGLDLSRFNPSSGHAIPEQNQGSVKINSDILWYPLASVPFSQPTARDAHRQKAEPPPQPTHSEKKEGASEGTTVSQLPSELSHNPGQPTLPATLVTERSDGGLEATPELGALQLAFSRVLLIQLRPSCV